MKDLDDFAKGIAPIPPAKDTWVRGTIYGDSGVGKTRLVLTRKDAATKVLFANIEDGFLSVAGSNIQKRDLRTYQDFQSLFLYLKTRKHQFDTLWLDSFTEAKRFVTAAVAEEKVTARESKNRYAFSQDDYRQSNEMMRQWVWDLRSLPMHIFYVCLARYEKTPSGAIIKKTLDLGEGLANSLFAYSDLVGYLTIVDAKKGEEIIQVPKLWLKKGIDTQMGVPFDAKIRVPVGVIPPDSILKPTLEKIIAVYHGAHEGGTQQ